MCPGEMVCHNQINKKTAIMWEEVVEWRNTFGGVGLVVRLKQDLGIAQIQKALKSWNIQDGQIKRIMEKMAEEESSEEENNEEKSVTDEGSQRVEEVEVTQQKVSWKHTLKAAVTVARTKVNRERIVNFVERCSVSQEL